MVLTNIKLNDINKYLLQHLPEDNLRGSQALFVANEIVNMCDVANPETFKR